MKIGFVKYPLSVCVENDEVGVQSGLQIAFAII